MGKEIITEPRTPNKPIIPEPKNTITRETTKARVAR
jgi:hypothetical protein